MPIKHKGYIISDIPLNVNQSPNRVLRDEKLNDIIKQVVTRSQINLGSQHLLRGSHADISRTCQAVICRVRAAVGRICPRAFAPVSRVGRVVGLRVA